MHHRARARRLSHEARREQIIDVTLGIAHEWDEARSNRMLDFILDSVAAGQ